jgi:lipid-binding SYLF domain-containing protein
MEESDMLTDTTAARRPRRCLRPALAGLACLLVCTGLPPARAQSSAGAGASAAAQAGPSAGSISKRQQAAFKRVSDAVDVAHKMTGETGMPNLLGQALGIYIVPSYGRAALGVGAAGGSGVLLVRRADGSWGNPAFFNTGGISIGLQAGAEGGPIALLLMNPKAVDSFRKKNNFSISADAGLTVVNYARVASGTVSGDVIAWSGNKGLFGNVATIGVNDVRFNTGLTEAYYGKPTTAPQAIDSAEPSPQADALRKALASAASGTGAR